MDNTYRNIITEAYIHLMTEGVAENLARRIKDTATPEDLEKFELTIDIVQRVLQSNKDKIGIDNLKLWNKSSTDIGEVLHNIQTLYKNNTDMKRKVSKSGLGHAIKNAVKWADVDEAEILNMPQLKKNKHRCRSNN